MDANPTRILIAVDSSNEALDVVRYVGASAQPGGTEIMLYTVLGKVPETFWDSGKDSLWEPKIEALSLLKELDIAPARIVTRIVTGVRSRAASIVDEAKKEGCGTIVVGRRGVTEITDFSMGRVTNKLIQLAKEQTLCIVG